MRLLPVLLISVALAACNKAADQSAGSPQAANPATASGSPQENAETANAPAEPPFYIGRWAAAETACGHEAWEFTETGLRTPGETSCTFERVTKVAAGYDIDATCTAEGPPRHYRMTLSYAQSARALLVDGGPFQPVGLIACR